MTQTGSKQLPSHLAIGGIAVLGLGYPLVLDGIGRATETVGTETALRVLLAVTVIATTLILSANTPRLPTNSEGRTIAATAFAITTVIILAAATPAQARPGIPASQLATVVAIAIIAPMVEEIVFRHGLYRAIRTAISNENVAIFTATAGSSFIFALAHGLTMTPRGLVGVGLVGCVFAMLYEHTRSIRPVIAVHALLNTIALIA